MGARAAYVHVRLTWGAVAANQIQFTGAMILGINGIQSGCDFPVWMQYALVIYMISFIVLFGRFYAMKYLGERFDRKYVAPDSFETHRVKSTKKE